VRTDRNVLLTLMLCGALGGLAGAFQVLFTRGRLVPGISGGLGFLGVLIVLLVDMRAAWVLPVTLFFAIVPIGSLRLASALDAALQVDSRLGNVFQSALVLAVILAGGMREQIAKRRQIL
jgi:general nucleoside transport system permease protein